MSSHDSKLNEMSTVSLPLNEMACANSSLVPIDDLRKVAEGVCKIVLPGGTASGFLCVLPFKEVRIAGLMTNEHVITSQKLAEVDAGDGNDDFSFNVCFETAQFSEIFQLSRRQHIGRWFSCKNLDATFLELHPEMLIWLAEKKIKPLQMSTFELSEGLEIAVIQYPRGGKQQFAPSTILEVWDQDFKHTATTDYGSSGSPVIDIATWTVVGIHKRRAPDDATKPYNWAVSMRSVINSISTKFHLNLKSAMRRRLPAAKRASIDQVSVRPKPAAQRQREAGVRSSFSVESLFNATRNGDLEDVALILDIKPDLLEARNEYGNNTLHTAALYGHLNIVKFLVVEKSADVETKGAFGRTPVLQAAVDGHLSVVKFLVEQAGANIKVVDSDMNSTVLHLAASFGHVDLVAYLLNRQPDLLESAKDKFNNTALNKAAINGHLETVRFLVAEKGANVEAKGGECGRTPLIQAAQEGHLPVIKFLVERGRANVLAKDVESGNTALHLAVHCGHATVIAYLIDAKEELLLVKNKFGKTPFSYVK